ncbi:MAG: hypothetical protein HY902_16190 [Deltaproteobacteria bacterium]|nr:hypothetical protein [Deltaproteobacteria bacterium]
MPLHAAHDARSIHLRALRAAAAVALGAACSSTAGQNVVAVANDTGQSDSTLTAHDAAAGADTAGAPDSSPADSPVADSSAADTAASPDVAAQDGASGDAQTGETMGGKPDCKALGLDMGACCTALTTWCEAAFANDQEARNTCIFGPNYDSSTGCTPWGPPAPPAMAVA